MRTLRRVAAILATATLAAGAGLLLNPSPAQAHGALMVPGSRTYLCYIDGLQGNGALNPSNPACAAAVAQSGTTPLYNWFAVLDSNAAGRTVGYVPDGTLCSAGNRSPYDFSAYNAARTDWPATRLTSGGTIQMRYNNWAHHPGRFDLYITRDGWNQNRPLTWADLEPQPFFSITNPRQVGGPGSDTGYYDFGQVRLPSGKSGRHITFSHWIRSDSNENFYGCSDVVFDGGNGEVIGIGGNQPPPPPPSSDAPPPPPPSSDAPPPPPSSDAPPPVGSCAATYTEASRWDNGYQGNVSVQNNGSSSSSGWTATINLPSGNSITNLWGGQIVSTSGSTVTVRNESWNGALGSNASTTFGFLASGSGGSPTVSCTLS